MKNYRFFAKMVFFAQVYYHHRTVISPSDTLSSLNLYDDQFINVFITGNLSMQTFPPLTLRQLSVNTTTTT